MILSLAMIGCQAPTADPNGRTLIDPTDLIAVSDAFNDALNSADIETCLLYTSPSPRDLSTSRMPSSA